MKYFYVILAVATVLGCSDSSKLPATVEDEVDSLPPAVERSSMDEAEPIEEPKSGGEQTSKIAPAKTGPLVCESWSAVDGLGRALPSAEECGPPRGGKFVGLFYFLWAGGHEQEGPYNISKILEEPKNRRAWGGKGKFHWWEEPRFGYYVMDDEWVLMKHAQMLADAGVDVLFFDVTNALIYEKHYLALCKVFQEIRSQGGKTPQISFLFNAKAPATTLMVYERFYKKGLYPELWFQWKGKPLILTNPEGQPDEILEFFAIRRSWAWSASNWFGDGRDKWPWLDHSPQAYGWHEDPAVPEFTTVAAAQHATTSIGRSYQQGTQPPVEEQEPGIGLYFTEQWSHALKIDPEFIFITGWNEWVAQRFVTDKRKKLAGGYIDKGETWFVDQYNLEYSRDCEPMRGGFEDNYYYQMVSNIRKFKGVQQPLEVSRQWSIEVDGSSNDWKDVLPEYRDDEGDTRHRHHAGYASAGPYVNDWGRNDIVSCKIARDDANVYFMAKTAAPLVVPDKVDPTWMNLLLKIGGKEAESWEGFHYRIVPMAGGNNTAAVCAYQNGRWKKVKEIPFAQGTDFVELALPMGENAEHIQSLEIEFKWFDHMPESFTALDFMDHGDTAPNNRFRYVWEK